MVRAGGPLASPNPMLTTVDNPQGQIGQQCAERLIAQGPAQAVAGYSRAPARTADRPRNHRPLCAGRPGFPPLGFKVRVSSINHEPLQHVAARCVLLDNRFHSFLSGGSMRKFVIASASFAMLFSVPVAFSGILSEDWESPSFVADTSVHGINGWSNTINSTQSDTSNTPDFLPVHSGTKVIRGHNEHHYLCPEDVRRCHLRDGGSNRIRQPQQQQPLHGRPAARRNLFQRWRRGDWKCVRLIEHARFADRRRQHEREVQLCLVSPRRECLR